MKPTLLLSSDETLTKMNFNVATASSRRKHLTLEEEVRRCKLTSRSSLLGVSALEKVVDQFLRSPVDETFVPHQFTDDELTSLALAADANAPLDADAVPWNWGFGFERNLLPDWYMPRAIATGRGKGTKVVVGTLVAGLLIIGAFGLCITSGFLSLA